MAGSVGWEPFWDLISLGQAMDRFFQEGFILLGAGCLAAWDHKALAVEAYA
jgi:hypothetical protein